MTATPAPALTDDALYRTARPRLFGLAYRMLGQVGEAEDMVQEAFVRWGGVAAEKVSDPLAYLLKITARLCLDHLKSARSRRELYVGAWLPEPLQTTEPLDALGHDVTIALLLALDRLTPLERAAFLLHDIFDLPHSEVARTLNRSAAACRQLSARARRQVQQDRPRTAPDAAKAARDGDALVQAFFAAAKTGDTARLGAMLAEDVQVISDGGGKVHAALNPIRGRGKAIRLFAGLARKAGGQMPAIWRLCTLNGLPAIISLEPDGVVQASAIETGPEGITAVYAVRNPDKTRHLAHLLEQ